MFEITAGKYWDSQVPRGMPIPGGCGQSQQSLPGVQPSPSEPCSHSRLSQGCPEAGEGPEPPRARLGVLGAATKGHGLHCKPVLGS